MSRWSLMPPTAASCSSAVADTSLLSNAVGFWARHQDGDGDGVFVVHQSLGTVLADCANSFV